MTEPQGRVTATGYRIAAWICFSASVLFVELFSHYVTAPYAHTHPPYDVGLATIQYCTVVNPGPSTANDVSVEVALPNDTILRPEWIRTCGVTATPIGNDRDRYAKQRWGVTKNKGTLQPGRSFSFALVLVGEAWKEREPPVMVLQANGRDSSVLNLCPDRSAHVMLGFRIVIHLLLLSATILFCLWFDRRHQDQKKIEEAARNALNNFVKEQSEKPDAAPPAKATA